MVKVFHNTQFSDTYRKEPEEISSDLLTKVAEVDTNDLEKAFELTNHITSDWTQNEGVTPHVSRPRSTSAGDIMEKDGEQFLVAACGYKKIKIV